jgi:hypothetical protein
LRRHIVPWLAVLAVVLFAGVSVARARPYETFTLEEHDKIIAETPGCHASCTVTGARRTCTVKDFDCRAVCTAIQECKPDGVRPVKVCAVIRESK